ncbi:hypothetical protein J7413_07380 [Shimia sp. R10_1]|uniref:alpha/beta fold hydrolase n=1 Tax=Shimia sp. R10_1 TaxID=2821095 RepID=UPI001ADC4F5D|nr:alpha/beta fold hydrolase [Shimia sp. R10_1]MBO9473358.1 hypothetical protein [Shimia sp. R10_1]
MVRDFDQLTHLVYEAALDNSLWPELVLELTEILQPALDEDALIADADGPKAHKSGATLPTTDASALEHLSQHVRRAFQISERIVGLQEQQSNLSSVLNSFSFGIALLDEEGGVLLSNHAMQDVLPLTPLMAQEHLLLPMEGGAPQGLAQALRCVRKTGQASAFHTGRGQAANVVLLPREDAARIGFPPHAANVILASDGCNAAGIAFFAQSHGLTRREAEVLRHIGLPGDLREIAVQMGVSYETARTYLKRIYEKTNTGSRSELAAVLAGSPLKVVREAMPQDRRASQVRRSIILADGRKLEYFRLGAEDAKPVLVFDALAGVTIDVLGFPDRCHAILERLNVQVICPCRPGSFLSDPAPMESLRDFADDVAALLDQLGLARVGAMSVSYGNGSALAIAHELKGRVTKLVMSSACYPNYRHENWRELDQFYHMSAILGRYWPSMLRQIIPFLVRSILQNADRYFDRYCKRAKSVDDIRLLSHPVIRKRTADMLALRTAAGMRGMVEENVLNVQGWDFDVATIEVPVEIFQGPDDNVAPLKGAQALCAELPNAQLTVLAGRGHYHHIENWPWLIARAAGAELDVGATIYEIPDL